jgi:hypothetical protein
MPQRLKSVLIGTSLLFAAPAFAQDAEVGADATATTGDGTVSADANANVNADPNATGTADATATGNAMMGWWPQAVVDRPYMRGAGKITVQGDLNIGKINIPAIPPAPGGSITVDALVLGGTYGVSDQINVGALYAIPLGIIGDNEFNAAGSLDLWGGYQISHTSKLSLAATADFAVNLDNTDDMAIHAGLGARYMVAPKIGVFTGQPYGPGPVGNHLSVGLGDAGSVTFAVPVGAMFQATPQLNVALSTQLLTIGISDADTIIFGADYIPLNLGLLFAASDKLDVTASFNLVDLKEVGFDIYSFSVGARFHM